MMKLAVVLGAFVLLVSSVAARAQEDQTLSHDQVMADFGSVIEEAGLTIRVIHLNDQTVEALFTAPTKYALRGQARKATIFFVQGTVTRPVMVQPDLEWQIRQGADLIPARVHSISNFEANASVGEGDQYSGLVVADQLIDPRTEFTVENGEHRFDFAFSASQIAVIEDR